MDSINIRERITREVKRRGRKACACKACRSLDLERRCQSSGTQRFRLIRFAHTLGGLPVFAYFSDAKKALGASEAAGVVLVLAPTSQKTLPRLASLQYLWGCSCERAIPVRASSPRWALKVRTSPNACARERTATRMRPGTSVKN